MGVSRAYGGALTLQVDESQAPVKAMLWLAACWPLALLTWVLGCGWRGFLEKGSGLFSPHPEEVKAHKVRAEEEFLAYCPGKACPFSPRQQSFLDAFLQGPYPELGQNDVILGHLSRVHKQTGEVGAS